MIEGSSADGVSFFHADGSAYGDPRSVEGANVQAKVFTALCKLGFREGEVRRVLAALRRKPGAIQVTAEALLREAVARLTAAR